MMERKQTNKQTSISKINNEEWKIDISRRVHNVQISKNRRQTKRGTYIKITLGDAEGK